MKTKTCPHCNGTGEVPSTPVKCDKCNDTGVIETRNNDLPCRCPAGSKVLFNTVFGRAMGAEIKGNHE